METMYKSCWTNFWMCLQQSPNYNQRSFGFGLSQVSGHSGTGKLYSHVGPAPRAPDFYRLKFLCDLRLFDPRDLHTCNYATHLQPCAKGYRKSKPRLYIDGSLFWRFQRSRKYLERSTRIWASCLNFAYVTTRRDLACSGKPDETLNPQKSFFLQAKRPVIINTQYSPIKKQSSLSEMTSCAAVRQLQD